MTDDDLVSRLRAIQPNTLSGAMLPFEAADEIERLRREDAESVKLALDSTAALLEIREERGALRREVERLRAALNEALEGAEVVARGLVSLSQWSTSWFKSAKALAGAPETGEKP